MTAKIDAKKLEVKKQKEQSIAKVNCLNLSSLSFFAFVWGTGVGSGNVILLGTLKGLLITEKEGPCPPHDCFFCPVRCSLFLFSLIFDIMKRSSLKVVSVEWVWISFLYPRSRPPPPAVANSTNTETQHAPATSVQRFSECTGSPLSIYFSLDLCFGILQNSFPLILFSRYREVLWRRENHY